jgi:hypothetical protein
MIAIGAVVGDWTGGSALLQPCYHVLNGLPYTLIMRVAQGLECGSHAAAPAVHTIRRVVHRYPSWSRGCWMCLFRSSSRSGMHATPTCRWLCCKRFVLAHQRPRPAPAGGGEDACTQAGSLRHGEPPQGALAASLTQRDMWVMHSALGRGRGAGGEGVLCIAPMHLIPAPLPASSRWRKVAVCYIKNQLVARVMGEQKRCAPVNQM